MSKKKSKKKFVYIKMFGYGATVYISYKPWNEIFSALIEDVSEDNASMKEYGLIGRGDVFWNRDGSTYYCTSTWVRSCYRKEGNGLLLYKALILAATRLAERDGRMKKGKVAFSSHAAAGCTTSTRAWRVYKALHRRGYLELKHKKKSKKPRLRKKNKFIIARLPKNFKPFFYTVK